MKCVQCGGHKEKTAPHFLILYYIHYIQTRYYIYYNFPFETTFTYDPRVKKKTDPLKKRTDVISTPKNHLDYPDTMSHDLYTYPVYEGLLPIINQF